MRKAFTLMELMIVVGIIAVLASMAFPAFSMIRRQVNQLKCSNNLKQIALALEVYRQEHNDSFPYYLRVGQSATFDPLNTANIESMELPAKMFVCPLDKNRGMQVLMGRRIPSGGGWGDYSFLHEKGSSYLFEASSIRDTAHFPSDLIDYFYRDMESTTRPSPGTTSWAEAKLHQQKFGNLKDASKSNYERYGNPFVAETMPIVRCYHHVDWNVVSDAQRKVSNVSLGFNIFLSSPYWEKDVTPNIDP
ncbi:MAG: type II secretion system protein [Planctomycetes bacterium]|nr:type II secretion system protein [Planctomycetota bacterium]